jgi:hypothetical protein
MRTPLMTAVTILFYFDAFAWSIGVVPTLYYAFTYEALPTVGGIRLMGGPFESLGLDSLGDRFRLCQLVKDSGRVLAMEPQKRRRGSWSDFAGA